MWMKEVANRKRKCRGGKTFEENCSAHGLLVLQTTHNDKSLQFVH